MIHGIGIDIVEVGRFKKFKNKNNAFLKRVFTKQEMQYCFMLKNPAEHFAGLFAAKEAVIKANDGKINIFEIEIRHKRSGAPEAYIRNKRAKNILISISHTITSACAVAILL